MRDSTSSVESAAGRTSSPPYVLRRRRGWFVKSEEPASAAALAAPLAGGASPRRGRSFWAALATLLVFAAGFWQFALLDLFARPAEERVNNGRQATFFAVHINPYYVFSEDFHLYVVRAKRILDRGWTDSPLAAREGERTSFSAPVQVALGMIAVATDGRPVPYTGLMFAVIAAAWCGLLMAARRWLPESVSTRSILVAVLATVLFESIGGLSNRELEYAQWPVHRGLRLSTMAWTSPLVLAVALASTSLLFDRRRSRSTAAVLAVMLLVLAGSDNWAFVLALGATGVAAAALAVSGMVAGMARSGDRAIARGKARSGDRATSLPGDRAIAREQALALRWKSTVGMMAAAVTAAVMVHQLLSGGMSGDVLARGGMGEAWLTVPEAPDAPAFWGILRRYVWTLVAMLAAACVYVRVGLRRTDGEAWARLAVGRFDAARLPILAPAAAAIVALVAVVPALYFVVGMEEYHAFQFIWRAEYCLIFAIVLLVSEWVKLAIRRFAASPAVAWRLEVAATLLVVMPLFGYHNYRIHRFVTRTAASEFFLTEDEERLRDWLRTQPPESVRSLATASHELNYLCAYWTNADLLLPEGFPYHNAATNDEIEDRMAELLHLYRANPDGWTMFNKHGHSDDQWSWHESRLRSAREGYSYYLMHRAMSLAGHTDPYYWARSGCESEKGTTALVAEIRRRDDRARVTASRVRHGTPIAAVEMTRRIGRKLAERQSGAVPPPRPDVIVVDEVSRALGTPDLSDYRRAFAHGTLEAWVRR